MTETHNIVRVSGVAKTFKMGSQVVTALRGVDLTIKVGEYLSIMRILWFSFFLGWLANHLTIRYGGVVLFRRVRLLFAGLILGDFLMGGVFAVIGLWMGQSYLVLPN